MTADHPGEKDHAVLIKPHEGSHFASFECFIISTVVNGNGIIGTVESPETGVPSNTAAIVFQKDSENPHTQTHRFLVGDETEYGLNASVSGATATHASETATGTLTFAEGQEVEFTEDERPACSVSLRQRGRRRAAPLT